MSCSWFPEPSPPTCIDLFPFLCRAPDPACAFSCGSAFTDMNSLRSSRAGGLLMFFSLSTHLRAGDVSAEAPESPPGPRLAGAARAKEVLFRLQISVRDQLSSVCICEAEICLLEAGSVRSSRSRWAPRSCHATLRLPAPAFVFRAAPLLREHAVLEEVPLDLVGRLVDVHVVSNALAAAPRAVLGLRARLFMVREFPLPDPLRKALRQRALRLAQLRPEQIALELWSAHF